MKKNGLVLVIVLVALAAVAWIAQLSQTASGSMEYRSHLKQAEEYNEKELFQKAIVCYDNALALKDTIKGRELWLDAYKNAFEDQAIELSDYATALSTVCDLYPEETVYWERLIALYWDNDSANKAHESYQKCCKAGVTSDTINEYGKKIMYSFRVKGRTYPDYVRDPAGFYTVSVGEEWGVLDAAGETVRDNIYAYISPYNDQKYVLYVSGYGQRLMDADKVVQAKINVEFTKTGAYADGLLPVCGKDGSWQYLDCETNTFVPGVYEYASNFSGGVAAVCKNNQWMLINTAGEKVSNTVFSDVKLHDNGDFVYDGVMVAAENGQYGLYDATGAAICGFTAKDMDVYMGDWIAFADNSGKWGYVSKEGETVLEAQFAQAKSFSGTMAAVGNGALWGFIDAQGEVVIDYQFLEADYMTNEGVCFVCVTEGMYNLMALRFPQ